MKFRINSFILYQININEILFNKFSYNLNIYLNDILSNLIINHINNSNILMEFLRVFLNRI